MKREQFFADCAGSYPGALLAISHFRDYVREECQGILNKRLAELRRLREVTMPYFPKLTQAF